MQLTQGGYVTIDFDMPDEDRSQRYTLVAQKFVEFGDKVAPDVPRSQQKAMHLEKNHIASPRP